MKRSVSSNASFYFTYSFSYFFSYGYFALEEQKDFMDGIGAAS